MINLTTTDNVPTETPDVDSTPGTYGPEQARCASCAGAACWEVPFASAPHYEYYCAACLPSFFAATPIDPCDFCHRPAHHGACPELIAYTDAVKARMHNPCDLYGISLELRQRISIDVAERMVGLPF